MKSYVDKTGQYARITTFMKDIGTEEMAKIEKKLNARINKIFPKDSYEVTLTGNILVTTEAKIIFQERNIYAIKPAINKIANINDSIRFVIK